ncbi:MAG: glycine cleavage system protein GcvH [Candidatus Dormibacteria bacterium]
MNHSRYPKDLRYHSEHVWARLEGSEARLGITWYAQDSLGEVLFFTLPKTGSTVAKDQAYAKAESAKAVSDVYAPLSGTVVAVNNSLVNRPELSNQDPYGSGWVALVQLSDPSEVDCLMSADEYVTLVDSARPNS